MKDHRHRAHVRGVGPGSGRGKAAGASLAKRGRGAVLSRANGGVLSPVGWVGKPDPHAGRDWSGMIRTPRAHAAGVVAIRYARPRPRRQARPGTAGASLAGLRGMG